MCQDRSDGPGAGRVLVVDDNREVLTAIRLLLKEHVARVHTATDPAALPALLDREDYDVVLLDMNFMQGVSDGREGFLWLARLFRTDPELSVILITAYGDIEMAVRAMKEGASDFVVKPWKNERLLAAVTAAVRLRRSRRTLRSDAVPSTDGESPALIGESPALRKVLETIDKVAPTDASVLILGEHGTGKEMVARAVHRRSRRAAAPFVTVDLGALSESLFESELFGHVKGAFTGADRDRPGRFEGAAGGTLFLDEIGNIPLALQRKLLTVLERREVTRVGSMDPIPFDVRIVSATNRPVYEMASAGGAAGEEHRFREDLLFRINTVEIRLPPLRERGDDVLLLAHHYLRHFADCYASPARSFSPETEAALRAYHWPGNVRELKHTLERAVILGEGPVVRSEDITFSAPPETDGETGEALGLEALERTAIRRALSKNGGNISRAAEELGLTRWTLYRRIEKYGL